MYARIVSERFRRNAWLQTTALSVFTVLGLVSTAAPAQAQPKALMQWGKVDGLDNRLAVSRVPVRLTNGTVKYYDVALTFAVDATGKLTLNTTATRITLSPELLVGTFKPGIYKLGGTGCLYAAGGSGPVDGGRVAGSIAGPTNSGTAACSSYSDDFYAGWTTGPIAGHPNEESLTAAGITFGGYAWGSSNTSYDYGSWQAGDIVGAAQVGNQIVLHNFGDDATEDTALVFTLCPSCS